MTMKLMLEFKPVVCLCLTQLILILIVVVVHAVEDAYPQLAMLSYSQLDQVHALYPHSEYSEEQGICGK